MVQISHFLQWILTIDISFDSLGKEKQNLLKAAVSRCYFHIIIYYSSLDRS